MPSQNQDNHKIEIPSQLTPFKEEKKITIHVTVKGERNLSIRQDSFLMCNLPHRKAFLLFSCNAPIHPETSFGTDQQFTLVFGSLSDECNKFNFIEGKLHPGMLLASDICIFHPIVYHHSNRNFTTIPLQSLPLNSGAKVTSHSGI